MYKEETGTKFNILGNEGQEVQERATLCKVFQVTMVVTGIGKVVIAVLSWRAWGDGMR